MNNFIRKKDRFQTNIKNYSGAGSLYFEKRLWDVLDKAKLVGEELCQGKND